MRLAVIGAMQEEVTLFHEHMEKARLVNAAGMSFTLGDLHDREVVLCKTGVGKVNASLCTQMLIDRFEVEGVILTGVAGSLHPELKIGDLVISRDCMQHDVDATALGFALGEIPFADISVFPADTDLVQRAEEAARLQTDVSVVAGRILSGDQFIADRKRGEWLRETMQGDCVEMEGAAVAQVCHLNEVPYVVIRTLSDQADGSAPENFAQFVQTAAERSFNIVQRMLADWDK